MHDSLRSLLQICMALHLLGKLKLEQRFVAELDTWCLEGSAKVFPWLERCFVQKEV